MQGGVIVEYIEGMNKLMMSILCGGALIAVEKFIIDKINDFYA